MENESAESKKNKRQVVYVKPILTFDQVVEIIDERIEVLEQSAIEMEERRKKKRKK
jgi:hypothetical protein